MGGDANGGAQRLWSGNGVDGNNFYLRLLYFKLTFILASRPASQFLIIRHAIFASEKAVTDRFNRKLVKKIMIDFNFYLT